MDRQLKERLVGVGVIIVLMIVFVPMILDGPESTGTRSKAVDLPEQDRRGWQEKSFSLDGKAAPEAGGGAESPSSADGEAVSGSGSADAAEADDETSGAPASAEPAADRSDDARPEPRSGPGTESGSMPEIGTSPVPADDAESESESGSETETEWAVQVGSFSREENAEGLASRLRDGGFDVHVTPFRRSGDTLYRVRVGPVAGRAEAERLAERVRAETDGPAKPVPAE